MKLISGQTYFVKRVFPALWFGILVVLSSMVLIAGDDPFRLFVIMIAIILGGVAYFLFKKNTWILVDEVYDGGDHLLCIKNGKEKKVIFSDIEYVSHIITRSPEKIKLHLMEDRGLGKVLTFILPLRSNRTSENPLVIDLKKRVDRAKTQDE